MSKRKDIAVRPLRREDREEWLRMRLLLWPDAPPSEVDDFFGEWRKDPTVTAVLVADRSDGRLGGFVEIGVRGYAEGCDSSPVSFIEGWFVDGDLRRSGVGAALIRAAEDWARAQGFSEMGSDALLANDVSIAAHQRLGFEIVERLVTFAKKL